MTDKLRRNMKEKIAIELHYYFDSYMPNPSHKVWQALRDNQREFWLDRAEQLMSAGIVSKLN